MKAFTPLTLATALLFAPACGSDGTSSPDGGATTGDTAAPAADTAAPAADTAVPTGDTGGSTADVAAGETAASTGDGGATGDAFTTSSGAWVVFDLGDAGANPAKDIMGSAAAYLLDGGKTKVTLTVTGLTASKAYGSHVHKLTCAEMMAGGHYQNTPGTGDGGPTDPMFGNATNEIWLDFTTDAAGKGMAERTVDFRVRPGEAKSIVVHAMMTKEGGLAGTKLACLPIAF
jgi:Cu-Zn family superoxide dismutase